MLILLDVVHLAHSYMVSKASTREGRVRESMAEIGISVLSGMVTSVGASLILFACDIQFFMEFGGFLCSTIGISWIWSNFFFMGLLSAFGPTQRSPASTAPVYF